MKSNYKKSETRITSSFMAHNVNSSYHALLADVCYCGGRTIGLQTIKKGAVGIRDMIMETIEA